MGIQCIEGSPGRNVVIRLSPGTDVLDGIERVCEEKGIKSGAVVSCIGSLQRASFMVAVPTESKIGAGYGDPVNVEGPLELLGGQGSIGEAKDKRTFVHLHAILSEKDGKIIGGHLVKGKNPVLITCEIVVIRFQGVRMRRDYDPEVEMELLSPFCSPDTPEN